MNKLIKSVLSVSVLAILCPQAGMAKDDENPVLARYFDHATATPASPDKDGFIKRWVLLEPISKEASSNSVWIDSYLREAVETQYFKDQFSIVPYDGEKIMVGKEKMYWHALDSKDFYVNLLRFAEGHGKDYFGKIFWVVTTVNCESDMEDVRLSSGANSAAMWYLNGEEVLMMSNDRDLIVDDCMSGRLTLKKGRNIVRGAILIGPGMADFCLRFIDKNGNPVKNISITADLTRKK